MGRAEGKEQGLEGRKKWWEAGRQGGEKEGRMQAGSGAGRQEGREEGFSLYKG